MSCYGVTFPVLPPGFKHPCNIFSAPPGYLQQLCETRGAAWQGRTPSPAEPRPPPLRLLNFGAAEHWKAAGGISLTFGVTAKPCSLILTLRILSEPSERIFLLTRERKRSRSIPRTMPIARPAGRIPDAAWTSGLREMTEPWKGALGCLGVAVFFTMTIGIISWQALEQSPEEWVLRGRAGGVLWERRRGALLLRALPEGQPVAVIAVGGVPAAEPPPPRDRCWQDRGQFCYAWEEAAELRLSLEPPPAPGTECYGVRWTPLRPDVMLKVPGIPCSVPSFFTKLAQTSRIWPKCNISPARFIRGSPPILQSTPWLESAGWEKSPSRSLVPRCRAPKIPKRLPPPPPSAVFVWRPNK